MTDSTAPRPTLREIKERHQLQDVLPRYVELKRSGDCLVGKCPFHDDRNPSFAAYLQTQTWQCFAGSCGLHGDVIDFVGHQRFGTAWSSRDRAMLSAAVEDITGDRLPPQRAAVPADWRIETAWQPVELTPRTQLLLHTAAALYHTTLLARGREPSSPYAYLRDARGFNDATIRREAIGYAEGDLLAPALASLGFSLQEAKDLHLLRDNGRDFMAGRLVFVERDRAGRVLHLIGRKYASWMNEAAPKYLSLKEMTKPLYGYERLDKRPTSRPVILVESPPDALTARQWGHDALANTGTQLKADHAARLSRLQRPLLIVPHNDEAENNKQAGWTAAEKWKAQIGQGTLIPLPDGVKDLNELGVAPDGERHFAALLKQFGFEPQPKPAPLPGRRLRPKTGLECLTEKPLWQL